MQYTLYWQIVVLMLSAEKTQSFRLFVLLWHSNSSGLLRTLNILSRLQEGILHLVSRRTTHAQMVTHNVQLYTLYTCGYTLYIHAVIHSIYVQKFANSDEWIVNFTQEHERYLLNRKITPRRFDLEYRVLYFQVVTT